MNWLLPKAFPTPVTHNPNLGLSNYTLTRASSLKKARGAFKENCLLRIEASKKKVLAACGEWVGRAGAAEVTGLSERYIGTLFKALREEGRLQTRRVRGNFQYRRPPEEGEVEE